MDRTPLARSGSERQDAVEPGQRGIGALEAHDGAEIVARRLDRLAAAERGDDFGRAMAQAVAAHEDAGPIIGLDVISRLEIGNAVRPHDLPIRTGQNLSL